ncbi:MAG TPA: hypothetical protein VJV79_18585 [Polyangiaceae bacterium]|nr:hypothetical protein [Polyangiaceae bacterium]
MPSRFGRAVALAAAVCALGVAGGCGRETFDLLPDSKLDSAGQRPSASAGSDAGGTNGGSSAASGKAGGGAGKADVAGSGGRSTTFPGAGGGNFPCLGEGGCADEEPSPCSISDPFCTPCRPDRNDCAFGDARVCDPELKRCVQCRKDLHCDPDERCNTNTWRCAKACGGSKDSCGDNQHLSCSPELGMCVFCTKQQDCTNDGLFNAQCYLNACVECFENAQCTGPYEYCVKGRCVQH